jgi:hypothetical protein
MQLSDYAIQQTEHELLFLKQRVIEKTADALRHVEHGLEYLQKLVHEKEAQLEKLKTPPADPPPDE